MSITDLYAAMAEQLTHLIQLTAACLFCLTAIVGVGLVVVVAQLRDIANELRRLNR